MDQKLTELLSQLSEKLGTTTEFIYQKAIKQVKLNFLVTLIQGIALAIFFFVLLYCWHHLLPLCVPKNPKGEYSFEREWPGEVQVMVCILSVTSVLWLILSSVGMATLIKQAICNLMNPEAVALEYILSWIGHNK